MNDSEMRKMVKAANMSIFQFDDGAEPGQFTKRLISLMKTVMRRQYNEAVEQYKHQDLCYREILRFRELSQ